MDEKMKILCVEDETLLLDDLKEELEDAGYSVTTARNGVKAMKKIKSDKPDLILCDMMMPEMDGPTLLKHVRQEIPSMDNVPFIFLTAKATRDDVIAGKHMGADDYLTKPIDFDLLLATVESRLRQVVRIGEQNRELLKKIHKQVLKYQSSRGRIKVAMVTDKTQLVAPINSALLELGCEVRLASEDLLKSKTFVPDSEEIVFLVYSNIVHFYLKYLKEKKARLANSKYIILGAPNMSQDVKQGILDAGIDEIIEYPYKPVEIFKQVVHHLRGATQEAKAS